MSDYPGFNGMEVVTKETVASSGAMGVPGICVLSQDGEGPFLDTGVRIMPGPNDIYALISVAKVIDMGRAIGMCPQHEVEALKERVAELADKIAEAYIQIDALQKIRELEPGLVSS